MCLVPRFAFVFPIEQLRNTHSSGAGRCLVTKRNSSYLVSSSSFPQGMEAGSVLWPISHHWEHQGQASSTSPKVWALTMRSEISPVHCTPDGKSPVELTGPVKGKALWRIDTF